MVQSLVSVAPGDQPWHACDAAEVAAALGMEPSRGLDTVIVGVALLSLSVRLRQAPTPDRGTALA
jgi:hypothetical protein